MSRLDTCRSDAFRKQCSERMNYVINLDQHQLLKVEELFGHSHPEKWFIGLLEHEFNLKENVDYETERSFHKFFLDFAWPEKRLCIEIDGELHRYEKQQINDAEKDRLLKEEGWKELRLTWSFIQSNKEQTKEIVKNFLENTGDVTQPLWKSKRQLAEEKRKENELNNIPKDKNGRYHPKKLQNVIG